MSCIISEADSCKRALHMFSYVTQSHLSKPVLHLNCAPRSGFHFLPRLSLPAVVQKPDRLCMGRVFTVHFVQIQAQYFCNLRALCPPSPSKRSSCRMWCLHPFFPSLLSGPRLLVEGTGTLTSSIWNAGKTPVNAGSSTQ